MEKGSNKRYVLIGILFFHTVNTYMDRICISAASDLIRADLNISSQTMGYIFGVFALGYALFQLPAGWLADRFGPRKALAGVVLAWSTFTALTGAAWNAVSMLVLRFLFGVGEAGAFPGATKAMYKWIPARERGMANGIFHSGARVGAAVSLFFLPFLIRWVGWRLTFLITGLLGLVWVAVWLWWYRDDPADKKGVSSSELDHIRKGINDSGPLTAKISLGQVLTSSNMLLLMFQYIASNITFFISFTWLLPYLVSRYGQGAEVFAPVPLLFGMFAQWFSGWMATVIYSRGMHVQSRKIPAIAGFSLSVAGLLLITLIPESSALAFTLLFSIAVFGVEMTISPSWSLCMDIGGENSGTVSASMNMLGNLGSALSAIIFPFFVARVTVPFFAPETGSADSFFVFAAIVNLLAILAWVLVKPGRKIVERSPREVRNRLILFLSIITLITAAVLIFKFLKG